MIVGHEAPFSDRWEIWTHRQPRNTTYPILYWSRLHVDDGGAVRTVEVRRVEVNPEGVVLPAERMVKGPRLPLHGFLEHYEVAQDYANG